MKKLDSHGMSHVFCRGGFLLQESVTPRLAQLLPPGELKGRKVIDADSFTDSVISSLQFMRQFEMVCDPVECGE